MENGGNNHGDNYGCNYQNIVNSIIGNNNTLIIGLSKAEMDILEIYRGLCFEQRAKFLESVLTFAPLKQKNKKG